MSNHYQVFGTDVVLLGRKRFLERLLRHLEKDSPEHVCVTGPKYIGKSTVLKALADHCNGDDSPYSGALYWNLSHSTPRGDNEFLGQLTEQLRQLILPIDSDLSEWFEEDDDLRGTLEGVFDELADQGKRVAVILDSLDAPLGNGNPSGNLLDWLRSLAEHESLRFVTGSRGSLQEICRTEAAETSPFWNIFYDSPMRLGPFDNDDWPQVLSPLEASGIKLTDTAKESVQQWTGGVPVLVAGILKRLVDEHAESEVHTADIDKLSENFLDDDPQSLIGLWHDCDPDQQGHLVALAKEAMPGDFLGNSELRDLRRLGYGAKRDGQIHCSCKLIGQFAQEQGTEVEHINRLFSANDDFRSNFPLVLNKRLSQIEEGDERLRQRIARAISDLSEDPELTLSAMRRISQEALRLIFEAECPNGDLLPEWIQLWEDDGHYLASKSEIVTIRKVPITNKPLTLRLLHAICGDNMSEKVSQHVSKPCALMAASLHELGNFGNHLEDSPVTLEFAASACSTAVELFDYLARELP